MKSDPMKRLLILLTAITFSTTSFANEKILVTVPPLYSLAASLLEGVDTPGLLFATETEMKANTLSSDHLKRIQKSSMVVWSGPQFETNLVSYLLQNPSFSKKSLTITETIPTFTKPDQKKEFLHANPHDMRFWLDPRLTILALKRMSTKMVTLYPDNFERILDNEAKLRDMIKKMEKNMQSSLENNNLDVPLEVPDSDILYLAWRYNLKVPKCPEAAKKQDGFQVEFGTELYFNMMLDILKELKKCQGMPDLQS